MYVVGVNPVLHRDKHPGRLSHREQLYPEAFLAEEGPWVEPGNSVIVAPGGRILAGPIREREETLIADLDLTQVAAMHRIMDPVGHYNRPDVFQLQVNTAPQTPVRLVTED